MLQYILFLKKCAGTFLKWMDFVKKPAIKWNSLEGEAPAGIYIPASRTPRIPVYSPASAHPKNTPIVLGVAVLLLMIAFFMYMRNTSIPALAADSFVTSFVAEKEFRSVSKRGTVTQKDELDRLAAGNALVFAFYRILPGENISSIAKKFGLSISTVLSLNSFDNAHAISPGQRILLASQSGILYTPKNQENLGDIVEKHGVSLQETLNVNGLISDVIAPGLTIFLPGAGLSQKDMADILGYFFTLPVKRFRFSSNYGMRRHPFGLGRILHAGVDLAAPTGTAVVAAREGRVVFAGTSGNYGLMVRIQHNSGFSTAYAHMSRIRVQVGQWVSAEQRVGDVGNTGRSTGPHLHFEVRKYGKPVHPLYNGLQLNR